MAIPKWQLMTAMDAIVFDCDGTLSRIEGIDELAKNNNTYAAVEALTIKAMGTTGLNPNLYAKRLELVKPTQSDVIHLGQTYFDQRVEDVEHVITLLQRLNKPIYIVSAGIQTAVALFGELLHIPATQTFAVTLKFTPDGEYADFDRASVLIHNNGKQQILNQLLARHARIAYIGDGLNDLAVRDLVTRFIGFGGIYYRDNIASQCEFYLTSPSMTALLPLILTATELQQLASEDLQFYNKGLLNYSPTFGYQDG